VIYLDGCSIVKLVVREDETASLLAWLGDRQGERLVTSMLSEVEVPRALRRAAPRFLGLVPSVLTKIHRFEVDAPVRATAAAYHQPNLRSLDAIHLATADNLIASDKPVTAFVTYDKRLAAAATEAGLPVVAPGAGD
jgi:predicted nucleic acid-binding protein